MSLSVRAISIFSCVSIVLFLATGCAGSTSSGNSGIAPISTIISGRVHGGQQPVSGATIQLYAVSTTANAGASTPMLTNPVTTASDGTFTITNDYTCPTSNPLVYIVATGGNPGLPGNASNSGIAMMSMIGLCNTLTTSPSTTFIFIDEITTVVAVQVLAPFMTDYAHIGSSPSSISGVGGAFATATSEVDFSTGQFGAGGTYVDLPIVTVNTLADIISACINTAGGSAPCTSLFSNTGGTSNTISAALQMAISPGQNTAALYSLITAAPPFQPYFTSVPTDFTSTVGYTIPPSSEILAGTLDSNGQVWLYLGGYNYNTATNTSTDSAGYIAVYDNNFNQLFTVMPGTGGLYYPTSLTPDASGHVFAMNANNTVSEFSSTGAALSPAAGWPTGVTSTFSPTGTGNSYVSGTNQTGPIAVDALGNIWGSIPYGAIPGDCYFELNSSGTNITPTLSATTGTFCTVSGVYGIDSGALDGLGNAWAIGPTSIAKVNAQGTLAATAPVNQGCFYPSSAVAGASNYTLAYESVTSNLLFDHITNHLWGYSQLGAGAITDAGVFYGCDDGPTLLPVVPGYGTTSTTPGSPYSAGSLLIQNAVLDGGGNLWFVTAGITETGVVGSTSGTFTGTAAFSSYLGEISSTGNVLTPFNASTQTYGLQPTGFGANATVTATNASTVSNEASVELLGVDRFGNIWALDTQSFRILKITGLAVANTVNY